MKILLINGYQKHDFCKGELNFSLYNVMLENLRQNMIFSYRQLRTTT